MKKIKVRASLYNTICDKEFWNLYMLPTIEIVKWDGYWEDNIEFPFSIDFEWLCFCLQIKIGRKEE